MALNTHSCHRLRACSFILMRLFIFIDFADFIHPYLLYIFGYIKTRHTPCFLFLTWWKTLLHKTGKMHVKEKIRTLKFNHSSGVCFWSLCWIKDLLICCMFAVCFLFHIKIVHNSRKSSKEIYFVGSPFKSDLDKFR